MQLCKPTLEFPKPETIVRLHGNDLANETLAFVYCVPCGFQRTNDIPFSQPLTCKRILRVPGNN